jgi:hypothetical protein
MARFFISYSRTDSALAQQIRNHISLLDSKHTVFLDSKDILVGEEWEARLVHEIENADYFILLLSQASLSSKWVEREVQMITQRELDSGLMKLFILKLDDAETPAFLLARQMLRTTENFTVDFFRLMEGIFAQHSFFNVKHSLELEDEYWYQGKIWIDALKKFMELIYMVEYRFDYSFMEQKSTDENDRGTIVTRIETLKNTTRNISNKFQLPFRTTQHFTVFVMLYLKNTKEICFVHHVYLTS